MTISRADPLPSEKDSLIRLVKGVVLAQGNEFIKELLRTRGIRIGSTKADFEENMMQAIEKGELQRQHVELWLNEVEGWGDQHSYLFKLSRTMSNDTVWRDPKKVEAMIIGAGFAKQWGAKSSLEYPPARKLTGIYFDNGVLRFVWHKGLEFWLRDTRKDYNDEIDGDTYQFRAYRMRAQRSVTRFELRPFDGFAAIFLQVAVDEDEHKAAIDDVKRIVNRVWSFDEFEPLAIAAAIKKLDARSLTRRDVTAHSTRLNSADAYVEFGASSIRYGYQDSTAVREVRQAVRPGRFTGTNGNFKVPAIDANGEQRQIRVQLYGEQRRIKLASQMSATEVWSVLHLIGESA